MSRTDKTTPYWVKTGRQPVARHHHFYGDCDLPADPLDRQGNSVRTLCYWEYVGLWRGEQVCGCRMCTAYYERKWDRRKERYEGKRAARDWDAA